MLVMIKLVDGGRDRLHDGQFCMAMLNFRQMWITERTPHVSSGLWALVAGRHAMMCALHCNLV
jgi:hypothetical protein